MRRLLPLLLIVTACARPEPEAPPASPPAPPAAPPSTTVGERVPYPFAQLIQTAPVALNGAGQIGINADTCGGCHVDIAREWRASTHAQAMRDPQFIAELAKPKNPRWLCLSCHRPLQAQAPRMQQADSPLVGASATSVGELASAKNRGHVPALTHEAITCATCHVRVAADGRGTVVGPRGDTAAPHRVTQGKAGLRGMCERCHGPPPGEHLTPSFTCWFETHAELEAGPKADLHCVDCHMPTVRRPLATGGPVRTSRRHTWVGGGVPKAFGGYRTLLARGWKPGVAVEVGRPTRDDRGWRVPITLRNAGAGHAVPTADPERHLLVIARSGAHRWVSRIGQTWEWGDDAIGRKARRLTDTRLMPGETRTLEARLPADAGGEVVVEVAHVRLSPDNLKYSRGATLDAELKTHRPGAQAVIRALERHYPTFTWVHRTRWTPGADTPTVTPLAALLAESAKPRSAAELSALLAAP